MSGAQVISIPVPTYAALLRLEGASQTVCSFHAANGTYKIEHALAGLRVVLADLEALRQPRRRAAS